MRDLAFETEFAGHDGLGQPPLEAGAGLDIAPRRDFQSALREAFSLRRVASAGFVALALLGGIFWLDHESDRTREAAKSATAPRAEWIEIAKPFALFGLASPDFDKRARTYEARRHSTGGGRKDRLTFGAPDGQEPFAGLEFYRTGTEAARPASFYVDMVREAASSGLSVERSGQPGLLKTRFGDFETADMNLRGAAGEAQCLGVRLNAGEGVLRISGMVCGGAQAPADRALLACLLDRIDLVSAGDDLEMQVFFVEAEKRRTAGCSAGPPARTAARTSWLDPNVTLPALRGAKADGKADKKARGTNVN